MGRKRDPPAGAAMGSMAAWRSATASSSRPVSGSSRSHSARRAGDEPRQRQAPPLPGRQEAARRLGNAAEAETARAPPLTSAMPPRIPAQNAKVSAAVRAGFSASAWPMKCRRARCAAGSSATGDAVPGKRPASGRRQPRHQAQQARFAAAVAAGEHQRAALRSGQNRARRTPAARRAGRPSRARQIRPAQNREIVGGA